MTTRDPSRPSTPPGTAPAGAERAVVRTLRPAEWELYREVRLRALADAPEAFGSTWERESAFPESRWRQRLEQRTTFLAVDLSVEPSVGLSVGAADGVGAPLGLAGLVPDEEDPEAAELVSMWVAPEARGRGVAELLIEAAWRQCSREGLPRLSLWVVEGNTRAERLYSRLGFSRTGRRQPVREGDPRQEIRMQRIRTDL